MYDIIKKEGNLIGIKAIDTSSALCNPASFKLMEKLGFTRRSDKTHINSYTFGGNVESVSYGLNKEEYKNITKN